MNNMKNQLPVASSQYSTNLPYPLN